MEESRVELIKEYLKVRVKRNFLSCKQTKCYWWRIGILRSAYKRNEINFYESCIIATAIFSKEEIRELNIDIKSYKKGDASWGERQRLGRELRALERKIKVMKDDM